MSEDFSFSSREIKFDTKQVVRFLKKRSLFVPAVFAFLCIAIAPFWYTGGYVNNKRITSNVLRGPNFCFGLGSRKIFAFKGQIVELKVDVHNVNFGSLGASIWEESILPNINKDEFVCERFNSANSKTLKLKASRTGLYEIDFDVMAESEHKEIFKKVLTAKADVTFSASWCVYDDSEVAKRQEFSRPSLTILDDDRSIGLSEIPELPSVVSSIE